LSESQSGRTPAGQPYRAPPPRKRPAWRTALWIVGALLVAALVAFLLTPHGQPAGGPGGAAAGGRGGGRGGGGGGGAGGGGSGRRPPTVVGVATAALGDIPIEVTALGTVTPQANVTVQSQISGTLTGVFFQEGQTVRKGQLLAEVDERPYQVALLQAQGQLLRDQAALDGARVDLNRFKILAAQDSIARQQLDDQAATVRQDEGVVKSDQASIASAKLNIAYCHIVAPVPGRVGLRQVDPGNYITPSEPNGLVVVNEVDPITVIFAIPEDSIPQIAVRMASQHSLPTTAYDRTGATALAQGVLYTLDNQINTSTGTVNGRARFNNPAATLFPNQFVNVTVLVDTLTNVVTIPAVAIRHGPQGDFVYVIQDDSTVKVTPVKVGPAQGETSSIASGLAVGDQVVTEGGDRLSDGSRVILPQDAARMAAMMNRKPKATGILGWIEGLFGHKDQSESSAGYSGQSGAGGRGGGGGGAGRMQAMLATLNLTADQQTKVKAIFADARTKAEAAGDDMDARRSIMQDANKQVEALLTPDQKAKFEAARAQARAAGGYGGGGGAPSGAPAAAPTPDAAPAAAPASSAPASSAPHGRHAHGNAESGQPAAPTPSANAGGQGGGGPGGGGHGHFMDALGLSPAQQAQAQAIMAEARASSDPDARHAAMQKIQAILTPEQKAKLAAMRAAREGGGGSQ
jgi:multidrug efflux system membrane fusion protein